MKKKIELFIWIYFVTFSKLVNKIIIKKKLLDLRDQFQKFSELVRFPVPSKKHHITNECARQHDLTYHFSI